MGDPPGEGEPPHHYLPQFPGHLVPAIFPHFLAHLGGVGQHVDPDQPDGAVFVLGPDAPDDFGVLFDGRLVGI